MSNFLALKTDFFLFVSSIIAVFLIGSFQSACLYQAQQKENSQTNRPYDTASQSPDQSANSVGKFRCEARNYPDSVPITEEDKKNSKNYRECYNLHEKLINSIKNSHIDEIRKSLQDGASPDGTSGDNFPPLHTAAMMGKNQIVQLLIENGATVNKVADFENTALNLAAAEGYLEIVRTLLKSGADVCYMSASGTAEDIARNRGYKEVAETLRVAKPLRCK